MKTARRMTVVSCNIETSSQTPSLLAVIDTQRRFHTFDRRGVCRLVTGRDHLPLVLARRERLERLENLRLLQREREEALDVLKGSEATRAAAKRARKKLLKGPANYPGPWND